MDQDTYSDYRPRRRHCVVRYRGGCAAQSIILEDHQVPDLWSIAQKNGALNKSEKAAILECWHLAHDLKKHIVNN